MNEKYKSQTFRIAKYLINYIVESRKPSLGWRSEAAELKAHIHAADMIFNEFTFEAIEAMAMYVDCIQNVCSVEEYVRFMSTCFFTEEEIRFLLKYARTLNFDFEGLGRPVYKRKHKDYLE